MAIRSGFDDELTRLAEHVEAMARMAGQAIRDSIRAILENDHELAREVVRNDQVVNAHWSEAQHEVMIVIARQQPLAGDLREILACFAIVSDLERIGDHAKGFAQVMLDSAHLETGEGIREALESMAHLATELLEAQVAAFLAGDPERARDLAERDAEIDQRYRALYETCVAAMTDDASLIRRGSRLMGIAKGLERVGDHVTNIGEWTVFRESGELVELNS